ncbi:MAG TPA: hypothetical protein VKC59_07245 [Candidatus Limnocylindrales bacterium]|nr:hypothetical protein [Candidatus Limnocylindrales bacterium]
MAVVLIVVAGEAGEPVLGPDTAERLRELGITRVSLLRDGQGIGLVLEGWAFDPTRADDASRAIFPGRAAGVRTFHEIERVAVSDARGHRRTP